MSPQSRRAKLMELTGDQLKHKGNRAAQKHKPRIVQINHFFVFIFQALYYYNLGIEKEPSAALYFNRGLVKNTLQNEHLATAIEVERQFL
jgi:hypothetical protein